MTPPLHALPPDPHAHPTRSFIPPHTTALPPPNPPHLQLHPARRLRRNNPTHQNLLFRLLHLDFETADYAGDGASELGFGEVAAYAGAWTVVRCQRPCTQQLPPIQRPPSIQAPPTIRHPNAPIKRDEKTGHSPMQKRNLPKITRLLHTTALVSPLRPIRQRINPALRFHLICVVAPEGGIAVDGVGD